MSRKRHIDHLATRCQEETQKFRNNQPHDPRFAYELFYLALQERDEYAWERLYGLYKQLVENWVVKCPEFRYCDEEASYFVNRAFERMWYAIKPERFAKFTDLAKLLQYLQMCVGSAIRDYKTPPEPAPEEMLLTVSNDDLSLPDYLCQQEFWEKVESYAQDQEEMLLITRYFKWKLTPKQLCSEFPDIFKTPLDVNRVKTKLVSRLKRKFEW